jgi:hypothetical protein
MSSSGMKTSTLDSKAEASNAVQVDEVHVSDALDAGDEKMFVGWWKLVVKFGI